MADYEDIREEDLPVLLGHDREARNVEQSSYDEFDIKPSDLPTVLGKSNKVKKPSMSLEEAKTERAREFMTNLIPLPIRPASALVSSWITGEPYSVVRQKMADKAQEAQDIVSREAPAYDVFLSTAEGAGQPITYGAATLGVGQAAGKVGSALAKTAPVQKVGSIVSKVPGAKPLGNALISTNPYKRAASWGGVAGTGTTAVNLAQGESLPKSLYEGGKTAADVAAYTIGSNKIPSRYLTPTAVGYELATGGVGRAMEGKPVLSVPDMAGDVSRGFMKKTLYAGSKLNERAPVEGTQVTKNAKNYAMGNRQKPFRHEKEIAEHYKPEMGHKTLRDVPTQTNVQNLKRFQSTVPEDVRETAKHYEDRANEFAQKIRNSIEKDARESLTENLLEKQEKLTKEVAKATGILSKEKVPVASIKKVFGKDTGKVLKQYAEFRSTDTKTFSVPRMKDSLDGEYLLGTRADASDVSRKPFHPFSRNLRDRMYLVFKDQEAANLLKNSNRQLSNTYEALNAAKEAGDTAKRLSDPKAIQKLYNQELGAKNDIYADTLKRVNNGQTVRLDKDLHTHSTDLLSKETQDLITEYDYNRLMADIANSPSGAQGLTSSAALDTQGRLVAAPTLSSKFSAYMTAKEIAKKLSKDIANESERRAFRFMNNTAPKRAMEAINPKPGNVFKHSVKPDYTKALPFTIPFIK